MAKAADSIELAVDGHSVTVSHPGKLLFPEAKLTKLDLVQYYLAVAEGALRGARGRPCVMVRFEPPRAPPSTRKAAGKS